MLVLPESPRVPGRSENLEFEVVWPRPGMHRGVKGGALLPDRAERSGHR